jgi:FemAB-related protein (PEP-CTERM system-associated)
MSVVVRELAPADCANWDAFAGAHPYGSPFHLQAWRRSIEESFGYKSCYVLAVEGDRLRAVLPLFLVRNVLVKKALISSPFAVYGGILADSNEAATAVYEYVRKKAHALGVQYLELRNAHAGMCVGEPNISRYVTFTQAIRPSEEAILEAIPRKTRYMVRKALKHDYSCRVTEDLTHFEALYSENLRRLGTPSFPHRYFASLLRNFKGSIDVREYWLHDRPVAAVLSFYFRDQVLPYYGAADPAFNAFSPSNFMYFDLMRWAGQNGYSAFDFGRSKKDSGSYEFKVHWGMQERELPYEMLLVRRKSLPNFSPQNPSYQLPIRIWRKLPLGVTRALGPMLVRLVP